MRKSILCLVIIALFVQIIVSDPQRVLENIFMPGYSTNDLDDLDPTFVKKVKKIIKIMESKGFEVSVSDTYRSKDRQVFIYRASKLKSKILRKKSGVTSTTNSKHNRTVGNKPASCAIERV